MANVLVVKKVRIDMVEVIREFDKLFGWLGEVKFEGKEIKRLGGKDLGIVSIDNFCVEVCLWIYVLFFKEYKFYINFYVELNLFLL